MTPEQVLYDISHSNLLLYGAATPSYHVDSKTENERNLEDLDWGGVIDYDNPNNFTDLSDEPKRI